jgi:hypothetical protein
MLGKQSFVIKIPFSQIQKLFFIKKMANYGLWEVQASSVSLYFFNDALSKNKKKRLACKACLTPKEQSEGVPHSGAISTIVQSVH